MKVDLDHIRFWMNAIRESEDPIRTLDAFWNGQISSKEWLINKLACYINNPSDIYIYGGWVGVLASMLFQSNISVNRIVNIDIDPSCKSIAEMMNKLEHIEGRFTAVTSNMVNISTIGTNPVAINTSCEHISQESYDMWLSNIQSDSLIVVQSNNYKIPEHCRIVESLDEFRQQCHLKELWAGQLELPLYTRFMIIGHKRV